MVRKLPDVDVQTYEDNASNPFVLNDLDDESSDSDSDYSIHSEEYIHTTIDNDGNMEIHNDRRLFVEEPQTNLVEAPPANAQDFREIFRPKRLFTRLQIISDNIPVATNYQTYLISPTIDFKKVDKVLDTPWKQYSYILDKIAWIHSNTPHKIKYLRVHPEFHKNGNIHVHGIIQFETEGHAMCYLSKLRNLLGNTKMDQIERTTKDFNRSLEYINKKAMIMAEVKLYPYTIGTYT